jgi:hypothetical protein
MDAWLFYGRLLLKRVRVVLYGEFWKAAGVAV